MFGPREKSKYELIGSIVLTRVKRMQFRILGITVVYEQEFGQVVLRMTLKVINVNDQLLFLTEDVNINI